MENLKDGEFLDNIFIVGGVALGLSRVRKDNEAKMVRLSVLPIGRQSGELGGRQSSATLFEVNLDELARPRESGREMGAIKDWEEFVIGREDIANATGVNQEYVSRKHFKITVMSDGRVAIEDVRSLNGTIVITSDDLMRRESVGGLSDGDREVLASFIEPLADSGYLWKREYQNHRVIDPGQ